MKSFLLMGSILLLSACSLSPAREDDDPLARLAAIAQADVAAADALAVEQGDVIAHACYPELGRWLATRGEAAKGAQVVGAISAFQRARGLRMGVQGGIPVSLRLACAALVQDERAFLLKLAAMVSGAGVLP